MGTVSYIISTKNRAAFLEKALTNIRSFVRECDELIVVDGGSSDGTAGLVARNRDIVKNFISEADFGEAHALNKGLLIATGEYIKLLTDDDHTFPEAMREAIAVLDGDPSIDALICGGEHCHINESGELKTDFYFHISQARAQQLSRPVAETGDAAGCGLGLVIRRRVLALTGLLSPKFVCVDTEYICRLKRPGIKLRYYDIKLYRHIDYKHSAVMNTMRVRQDAVLCFVSAGAWGTAMTFNTEVIARSLNLPQSECGLEAVEMFKAIEYLRRGRSGPWVTCLLARIMAFAVYGKRALRRMGRLFVNAGPQPTGAEWPLREPSWERVLR